MGLFGPFVYKSKKKNKNFWLHVKIRGKTRLYYFSNNPKDALGSLPRGFEVMEDSKSGLPFLKKKTGGFFGKAKVKKDKETQEIKEVSKK